MKRSRASIDIERIDERYRTVWSDRPPDEQQALADYFLPDSRKATLEPTRPRVIKWYCPFAAQSSFPTGHRYCANVYVACSHRCTYCYANGYIQGRPRIKKDFGRQALMDLAELELYGVPPAPLHLSNSTDPLQEELEAEHGHSRWLLERVLEHRRRFTTIVVLTKNPGLAVRSGYLSLFERLNVIPPDHPRHAEFAHRPGFILETSVAFWRQEVAGIYDRDAPPVAERLAAVRALASSGIPVVLRIDPLFPHSPLPDGSSLEKFGLVEAQTLDDLRALCQFARDVGVLHVVYSPVKLIQPRGPAMDPVVANLLGVYESMSAPAKPVFRGGSYRLPGPVAEREVVRPFLALCMEAGVQAKFCMQNLIETP
jgi:DNA repair photolyase